MSLLWTLAMAAPVTIGSGPVQPGVVDGWSAILVVDKATPYVNTGTSPVDLRLDSWSFYAQVNRGRVTPFLVRMDTADPSWLSDLTILAIGDTRTAGLDYAVGAYTLPFAASVPTVVVQPSERVAIAFLDADAAGNSAGSVIPFVPGSPILLSGSALDALSADLSGGVGASPSPGVSTATWARDYAFQLHADACVTEPTWVDGDLDGYGDPGSPVLYLCPDTLPADRVLNAADCDDGLGSVSPGATEVACNGLDDDCDAGTFDAPDSDLDGVDDCVDCAPDDAASFPGNPESCDGRDNDCDGVVDEGFPALDYFEDLDGDGFGGALVATTCAEGLPELADLVTRGGDCDDTAPAVHPDATEVCNGRDDDCVGGVDVDAVDAPTWYGDGDGDGLGAGEPVEACEAPAGHVASAGDCDDGNPALGLQEPCVLERVRPATPTGCACEGARVRASGPGLLGAFGRR